MFILFILVSITCSIHLFPSSLDLLFLTEAIHHNIIRKVYFEYITSLFRLLRFVIHIIFRCIIFSFFSYIYLLIFFFVKANTISDIYFVHMFSFYDFFLKIFNKHEQSHKNTTSECKLNLARVIRAISFFIDRK